MKVWKQQPMSVQPESQCRRDNEDADIINDNDDFVGYADGEECPGVVDLATSDRAMPNVFVKALFAYRSPTPLTSKLQEGLRKVLWDYREWTGRIKRDSATAREVVDITDGGGVVVIEACCDGTIEELMPFDPSPALVDLVPETENTEELLLIQFTRFSCQGLTVGVAWHHMVADGQGFMVFMNEWVRSVKGLPPSCRPLHDRSPLISCANIIHSEVHPPKQHDQIRPHTTRSSSYRPPVSARKLHFSVEHLHKLRNNIAIMNGKEYSSYTTFQILTAHLWKCITKTRRVKPEENIGLLISVDARRKLLPPLPDHYFGNVTFTASPLIRAQDLLAEPMLKAVGLIHASIRMVDNKFVRSTLESMEHQLSRSEYNLMPDQLSPNLVVASWIRFPLYEMDFGWGRPCFAGNVAEGHEGVVVLLPSHTLDGSIDAVVELFEPELASLEIICFEACDIY